MKKDTRTYKIIADPPPGFPHKKGDEITVPGWRTMYEYRDPEKTVPQSVRLEKCEFAQEIDPKNRIAFINIPDETTQEKYDKCTLVNIQYYYDHYGYLEDYQVKWLLIHLKDAAHHLKTLTSDIENKNFVPTHNPLKFLAEL